MKKTSLFLIPFCVFMLVSCGEDPAKVPSSLSFTLGSEFKTEYKVGEQFSTQGLSVEVAYKDSHRVVTTDYTINPGNGYTFGSSDVSEKKEVNISYVENNVTLNKSFTIKVAEKSPSPQTKTLTQIIVTGPSKTIYNVGEQFSTEGFIVLASYSDNSHEYVDNYVTNPANGYTFTTSDVSEHKIVVISYTYGGITKTDNAVIKVQNGSGPTPTTKSLTSIAVTTAPSKTTYKVGEAFSTSGMVVTATYSDSSSAAVTGYTTNPANAYTFGTGDVSDSKVVAVSYTEGGITKTTATTIKVESLSPSEQKIDVLTADNFSATDSNNYVDCSFSGANSGVTYSASTARYTSETPNCIQINWKDNRHAGIFTTASDSYIKAIKLTWNINKSTSGGQFNRVMNFYGSNTAYSSIEDVASVTPVGTSTLVIGATSKITEYTFTSNYKFFAMRTQEFGAWLEQIEITWSK